MLNQDHLINNDRPADFLAKPANRRHYQQEEQVKMMIKRVVRGWLFFVASLRALSVGLAYLKPDTLQEQVFAIANGQSACAAGFIVWKN